MPKLWTRNFIMLCLANFLMFTAFYFLIPILPIYVVDELGGNKSTVGIVLAVYTLAALIIRPFTGVVIDGLGRKTIYLIALILFTLLFNGYIFAESLMLLMVLRVLHGLTWGVTTTSGNTVAVDIIPAHRRGEGIGFFGLSFTVAMALGPFLGIIICGEKQYHALFFSAFLMSSAALAMAASIRYPHYQPKNNGKLTWNNLFEKKAMPVSLILILTNITYGGLISFIALYGKEIGIDNPGLFFLVYAIGVALTRFVSGRIFDRHGPKWLMIVGLLTMTLGFPILALIQTRLGFYFAALTLGLGGGVVGPTFQAMVNNMVEPDQRGAANSTLFTALDLGIGIGMAGIGYLSEAISITGSFLICGGIAIFALILFLSFVQQHYDRNLIPHIPISH